MTTGEILFYSGVVLFVITIITAIVFSIKKPEYRPEKEIYRLNEAGTEQLMNSYPTNPLTVRRKTTQSNEQLIHNSKHENDTTVLLENDETELLEDAGQETVLLDAIVDDETIMLEELH